MGGIFTGVITSHTSVITVKYPPAVFKDDHDE